MEYRLSEIAAICGGEFTGRDVPVRSVFTDSRSFLVSGDSLFVAIAGCNHDGHAYINELYSRGVRAFLVERDVATAKYEDAGFVRAGSSVEALQALAAHYRSGFKGKVVAVTGSNGKTIVKEWIAALVPPEVKLFRSPKSYNSQIGVPLSVLMMRGNEDVAVIEAGISLPGEMERLERIIKPDIGIITTIGDAHQENFGSLKEKAGQKIGLFKEAGTVIYNSAYPEIETALKEQYTDKRLVDAADQADAYSFFSDRASQENAAAAVTLCDVLGYDHATTVSRLCRLQQVAMRLELKEGINNSLIINDSYNSDINSLSIAIDYMQNVAGGRSQTLVLSDILQSGFPEEELYVRVAELVGRSRIDRVVGIGERIRRYAHLFGAGAQFYASTESYISAMKREDVAGRVVLLKGNRTSQFERLSHTLELKSHTTMLEVDLDAMQHNLNAYRALLAPGVKIMAMVKAAGYGHGDYEVAAMLQHQGVDYLAVAFADEGVLLRERGITMPIVVLNADAGSFGLMIVNSLEPEIYNFASLEAFADELAGYGEQGYPVHIKLDTGMRRYGFAEGDMDKLNRELRRYEKIMKVGSIFSHLAVSDVPAEEEFTRRQLAVFGEMSSRIMDSLTYSPLRHIANSGGIESFPQSHFDMVRLGIGLYGISANLALQETAVLRTRIVQVKELKKGDTVGYGREGRIMHDHSRVATIPIGYADGLDRHLGNGRWSVVVNGVAAPLVGRVCMDSCMVDITGIDASEGDEVVIYGGGTGNSVSDMARALDTIPYEIMTSLSSRIKRIYIKE